MDHNLAHGASIRRLWAADRDLFLAHLLRLDPESRHERFIGAISEDFLVRYADRCFRPADVIFGAFVEGSLRGAGELRPEPMAPDGGALAFGPGRAEAAFSVEAPFRKSGLGEALLARILAAAGAHRIETIDFTCRADNRAMQSLARKFAAQMHFHADQITGRLSARAATPLSLWREASSDAADYALSLFDRQLRTLARPGAPRET